MEDRRQVNVLTRDGRNARLSAAGGQYAPYHLGTPDNRFCHEDRFS